jgi:crossover junction endodeoxyribonuclease RusA
MVRVTFPVHDARRRDPHNLAPTVKAIVDGLVDAGVWPDDTDTWVIVLDPRFTKVPRHDDGDVVVDLIPRAGAEVWS